VSQRVRRNWSTVTVVGRGHSIFGALSGEHPLLAHEAGDAVAPSRAAEGTSQPRTTVGLTTARKLLANALAQANVRHLSWPGLMATLFPVVIATARDQERLA